MLKIKVLLCLNFFFFGFMPSNQVLASSVDEVICSAMQGVVEKELEKIPYKIDSSYLLVNLSVDCQKKTLITEKKHIEMKKVDFEDSFQKASQKKWESLNCSNMIFNTETGWATVQIVKDFDGILVSKVIASYQKCSK